ADASSPPPPNGCPSESDVATGAAVGKTCAPDGTYCADPACDPCTKTCAAVRCTQGVWTRAVNTAHCTDEDATTAPAAAVGVEIDPTSYDQTCARDADCFAITAGTFCSGAPLCMCKGTAINVDGESRYQQQIDDIGSRVKGSGPGC